MHQTLLDEYITTCMANMETMPICLNMLKAIQQTTPVAHKFDYISNTYRLPHEPIKWPDGAMCLFTPHGFGDGYYKFCADVGYDHKELNAWFKDHRWILHGVMLFQPADNEFDIIPLVKIVGKPHMIMPEVQLHFALTNIGWVWDKAKTGPVNALFHNVMINLMPSIMQVEVYKNIYSLGCKMTEFLGAYYTHLQQPGEWYIYPAHQAKGKMRNGKMVKVYKSATVGYKEFICE